MKMNSDEEVINNRMVFYIGISMILGDDIVYASNLRELLMSFTTDTINENYELLKLIYKTKFNGRSISFTEPAYLREITMNEFNKIRQNFNRVNAYYARVDDDTTLKLSLLGEKFCEYLFNFSEVQRGLLPQ